MSNCPDREVRRIWLLLETFAGLLTDAPGFLSFASLASEFRLSLT